MARHINSGHHRAGRASPGARQRSRAAGCAEPRPFAASVAVDEESHHLRGADVRTAAAGRARGPLRRRRRSWCSARCPASSTASTTSPIARRIAAIRSSVTGRSRPVRCRSRWRSRPPRSSEPVALAAAFWLRPEFGVVGDRLPGAAGVLFRPAEARRHHRRADDRDRLCAARRGGRRGDRRADQPLAAVRHDSAGAVPRAEQAPARARAARRRARRATGAILQEYTPYLLDQMISVVTASTLVAYAFYTVNPETVEKFHTTHPRPDAAVPALRNLSLPLSRAPEGGRRQPGRDAAERSAAARCASRCGRPPPASSFTARTWHSRRVTR